MHGLHLRDLARHRDDRGRRAERVLVIGAEILSRHIDAADRRTARSSPTAPAPSCSRRTDRAAIGPVTLGADGANAGLIVAPRDTGIDLDGRPRGLQARGRANGSRRRTTRCSMAGETLERRRPLRLPPGQRAHPALRSAERLGARPRARRRRDRRHRQHVGGLDPAGARRTRATDGRLPTGARVLLGAFGAGFTWGATLVTWAMPSNRHDATRLARPMPRASSGATAARSSPAARAASARPRRRRSPPTAGPVARQLPLERGGRRGDVVAEIEAAGGRALAVQADSPTRTTADAMFAGRRGAARARCSCSSTTRACAPTASSPQLADERLATRDRHEPDRRLPADAPRAAADAARALRPHRQRRLHRRPARQRRARRTTPPRRPGLIGLTKTVAAEVARRGVTVNAVAPGFDRHGHDRRTCRPSACSTRVPARRAGTPDEVAACVRFLASEAASYVTGTTLYVDGGLAA